MDNAKLALIETIRQILRYDAESGKLYWMAKENPQNNNAISTWNKRWAGKEALAYIDPTNGYKAGTVSGVRMYAHRAALLLHNGDWPEEVDHINGNRSDNRLENLRACSRSDNTKNTKKPKDNTSGVVGVSMLKSGKWRARICKSHIGRFATMEDAIKARKEAEAKLGFHRNHGRS